MKKDELLKINEQLEKRVEELTSKDTDIREYISGFLGSYKTSVYSRDEIETLSWAEIYFRLGKRIGSQDLKEEIDQLAGLISVISQRVNEKNKKTKVNPPTNGRSSIKTFS